MQKQEFLSYVSRINNLFHCAPNWANESPSIIEDYLKESTSYGYGKVIYLYLGKAYALILKYHGQGDYSADELAAVLYNSERDSSYKLTAFIFVFNLLFVVLGFIDIDDLDLDLIDENDFQEFDSEATVVGVTDPVEKELKKYAVKLLDITRNNQLVNFRPLKSSTMYLYPNDTKTLIEQVIMNKKIYLKSWRPLGLKTILQCKNKSCGRVAVVDYDLSCRREQPSIPCPICDANNIHGRKSMIPIKEKLVVLKNDTYVCESCGAHTNIDDLEKNDYKCPQCNKLVPSFPIVGKSRFARISNLEVVPGVGDSEAKDIAKTLLNKAKNLYHNFGLHTLYIAIGFLKWTDKLGINYNSPVLLAPINLVQDKTKGTYYFELESGGHSFEVNKTLLNMLKAYSQDVSFTLPDLNHSRVTSYLNELNLYFKGIDPSVSHIVKDWEVINEAGMGLFHYQKLQLENDITSHVDEYLKHPVIRRLCKDFDVDIPPGIINDDDKSMYMLLDADSSQEEVIKASLQGKSFVLQGPPGSGKSQTITNIIAANISAGTNVLFVTEKSSARSIIVDNLSRINTDNAESLTKFVLDFDNISKSRRAIGRDTLVNHLNNCLNPYTSKRASDQTLLYDNALYRGKIEKYMRDIVAQDKNGVSYMGLLQEATPYINAPSINIPIAFDGQRDILHSLLEQGSRFLELAKNGGVDYNYNSDPLFISGYDGLEAVRIKDELTKYSQDVDELKVYVELLNEEGFNVPMIRGDVEKVIPDLVSLSSFPSFNETVLDLFLEGKINTVLEHAKKRQEILKSINNLESYKDYFKNAESVNDATAKYLKVESYHGLKAILRISSTYRNLVKFYKDNSTDPQLERFKEHAYVVTIAKQYVDYCTYHLKLQQYNQQEQKSLDQLYFGKVINNVNDWEKIIKDLEYAKELKDNFSLGHYRKSDEDLKQFFLKGPGFSPLAEHLQDLAEAFKRLTEELDDLSLHLTAHFKKLRMNTNDYTKCQSLFNAINASHPTFEDYHLFLDLIDNFKDIRYSIYLPALISANIHDEKTLSLVLNKMYYTELLSKRKEKTPTLSGFKKDGHLQLMEQYRDSDLKIIETAGSRLFDKLSLDIENYNTKVLNSAGKLTKIKGQKDHAFKDTIVANWDYIRIIKPCFMMSPLNVSQYIDISLKFDLVIFDEASQIFTEDALASIVRGKQVIIAGDSKQLPPCDFFKAGDITQDDEENYLEEESKLSNSLLDAADTVLSDASISLAWHYRSYDESLIAFANKYMEYGLITFPSAYKDPSNGIRYHFIPYDKKTCYDAGKKGNHTNSGEAQKIVELLYQEMQDPNRGEFSLGVVAFSNAQALKIEEMWDDYKNEPDKKDFIKDWEERHAKEPIVFCNLDTMQGDERDTMIISTCYGKDKDEKFYINYLGRIRLASGKKRINVAITRSRRQMIVVTSLEQQLLHKTLANSGALEEHKEGAYMLVEFLNYAESFVNKNNVVSSASNNAFINSVCEILDEEHIEYTTEIGASECKINIGIIDRNNKDKYALGIIIDDPRRTDFDSPREYARLTSQVLEKKYGWELYRLFPMTWFFDHENEKANLLRVINEHLN